MLWCPPQSPLLFVGSPVFQIGSIVRNPHKPAYGHGVIEAAGTQPGTWKIKWQGTPNWKPQRCRAAKQEHLQLVTVPSVVPPSALNQRIQVLGGMHNGRTGRTVFKVSSVTRDMLLPCRCHMVPCHINMLAVHAAGSRACAVPVVYSCMSREHLWLHAGGGNLGMQI